MAWDWSKKLGMTQQVQYAPPITQAPQQPQQFGGRIVYDLDAPPPMTLAEAKALEARGVLTPADLINMFTRKGNTRNGAAKFDQNSECPECGSPNYFSMTNKKITKDNGQQVSPAPRCADCGYNSKFEHTIPNPPGE